MGSQEPRSAGLAWATQPDLEQMETRRYNVIRSPDGDDVSQRGWTMWGAAAGPSAAEVNTLPGSKHPTKI